MKKIKYILLLILSFCFMPNIVNAANGSITVSGSGTVIKGNSVTITVKLSSQTSIGSWQMDLDYDKSFLQLLKSSSESGGTAMAASSPVGIKSKSYTFTFKALKTGNTTLKVGSYLAYAFEDFKEISLSSSGKSIRIMTQEELEATYSSDATLKNIAISKGELSPKFDRKVYEYNVEVPNDVELISITGTKNDGAATVQGGGEFELEEGDNKIEIKVIAQKGNEQIYTINVYRKELDPIEIVKDNETYKIVRKKDLLKNTGTFKETTIQIKETEIPALVSEYTNITLVGVKTSTGEVKMYIYDNGLKEEYVELNDNQTSILPLELPKDKKYKNYKIKNITINNVTVEAYTLLKNEEQIIIYAKDTSSGVENYYLYDTLTDTFGVYRFNIDNEYMTKIKYYQYMLIGAGVLIFILLLIAIFKKGKKEPNFDFDTNYKVAKEEKNVEKEDEVTEVKEEKEIIDPKEKANNKKKKKHKKEEKKDDFDFDNLIIETDDSLEKENRTQSIEVVKDETTEIDIIKNTNKKMTKQEKKLAKEQQKLLKAEQKRKKEFEF